MVRRKLIRNSSRQCLPCSRDRARLASPSQHQDALRTLSAYRQWLLDTYIQIHRRKIILVMSLGEVEPSYRDEWPEYDSFPVAEQPLNAEKTS